MNEPPENVTRNPTAAAIASLASRFALPNNSDMQDWELEVSDPKRISEFLDCYESGGLNEKECFTIMETILHSYEELEDSEKEDVFRPRILLALENNLNLHFYSVWDWSIWESEEKRMHWKITPYMRKIFLKYKHNFY